MTPGSPSHIHHTSSTRWHWMFSEFDWGYDLSGDNLYFSWSGSNPQTQQTGVPFITWIDTRFALYTTTSMAFWLIDKLYSRTWLCTMVRVRDSQRHFMHPREENYIQNGTLLTGVKIRLKDRTQCLQHFQNHLAWLIAGVEWWLSILPCWTLFCVAPQFEDPMLSCLHHRLFIVLSVTFHG